MVWVKFSQGFRWSPPERPKITIAYRAGGEYNVRAACADAAVSAGAARRRDAEADHGTTGD
ncbi:hypothetical protein JET14_06050 [Martelella lutilitoris]|uniref:Uncharacterized protein n=1 Tax=Martelella lutilitoris TaxID=2583532 RepID=A0A7T7KMG9_9HYPH|nr:hypothetical protein [Martelella lutilitoris]QQM31730.1 hypothetical protein JET14_06050 [Martelella lutilitoris]